ncbi:hypothetical protein B0T11DRAFT_231207, partial [Plectosphaerella cucumerina]
QLWDEVAIENVEEDVFALVLLIDWSSRDLQVFEMEPLGPFHGKGRSKLAPGRIGDDLAREPIRVSAKDEARPCPVRSPPMAGIIRNLRYQPRGGPDPNLRYLYWAPLKQLAHHASAACGLGSGVLIGTGTISGGRKEDRAGCLYEATQAGSMTFELPDGAPMRCLEDGDEVVFRGSCGHRDGDGPFVGFGECRGVLLPARTSETVAARSYTPCN